MDLNELRSYVEDLKASVKMSRNANQALNDEISNYLKKYVSENDCEERCCFFVKNITPSNNICFVHKFTASEKSFQNLDLSDLPENVHKSDVIVFKNGEYVVDLDLTNEILQIEKRAYESLKSSVNLFKVEGQKYFVCEKSDDSLNPKMSLRIIETNEELWGIDISKELYKKIKYGSIVVYKNGEYEIDVN